MVKRKQAAGRFTHIIVVRFVQKKKQVRKQRDKIQKNEYWIEIMGTKGPPSARPKPKPRPKGGFWGVGLHDINKELVLLALITNGIRTARKEKTRKPIEVARIVYDNIAKDLDITNWDIIWRHDNKGE